MEAWLSIVEQKIKPPFKYFIVPQGFFKAYYIGFNTLKEAKEKTEELALENHQAYSLFKVFYNNDEGRLGYMGIRILTFDADFNWEKDLTQDFCLHVAFFFDDRIHRKWNPELYDKLKKEWNEEL